MKQRISPQTAYLVHVPVFDGGRGFMLDLTESQGLVSALGLCQIGMCTLRLRRPNPAHYIQSGHRERIMLETVDKPPDLFFFDCNLTPIQQRNLESALKGKVIDRTGLILEIFARRARSREGRLQVELAQLEYQKSRLVRFWSHLERQKGGGGFLAGPGERQIESDRRMIANRVSHIRGQIDRLRLRRSHQRKARRRADCRIVALVGYTNAGKSTLFNRFTDSQVQVRDQMFATLDPTMRALSLKGGGGKEGGGKQGGKERGGKQGEKVILIDTVGFISHLPKTLTQAFRATMEEILDADIIIHVRDASMLGHEERAGDVHRILQDMGYDPTMALEDGTMIEVFNKCDRLEDDYRHYLEDHAMVSGIASRFFLSAREGTGCDKLVEHLSAIRWRDNHEHRIVVPLEDGKAFSWLHRHARIDSCRRENGCWRMKASMSDADWGRFQHFFPSLNVDSVSPVGEPLSASSSREEL